MKKQIFILVILVVAVFANTNVSYGQAIHGSNPKTLTCANDPLNPVAGQAYDYSATFSPDGGTALWYATKSTTFINGSTFTAAKEAKAGSIVADATNYNTSQTASGQSTTSITWTSAGLAAVISATPTPLFVVVSYQAPTGLCANNMKVFNITPKNAFTIDIRSMESNGTGSAAYGSKTNQCVDDIESASYNAGTSKMIMDYGDQTLYFEVIAANFTGSFTPSFKISNLSAGQTAEIFWGITAADATTSLGAIANGTAINGSAVTTSATNTKDGVSIYVKVVVQNNAVEATALQTIILAVDAVNSENQPDVLETDCSANTAFADAASQDIKLRPTITAGGAITFIQ